MDVTIQYDGQDVLQALNEFVEAGRDLTPAMKSIVGVLEEAAEEAFQRQEAPAPPGLTCPSTPSVGAQRRASGRCRSSSSAATSSAPSPAHTTRPRPQPQ